MKITAKELRRLIKEEAARLAEAPMPRDVFYDEKVAAISEALNHLDAVSEAVSNFDSAVSNFDSAVIALSEADSRLNSAITKMHEAGEMDKLEDAEVQSAIMDLENISEDLRLGMSSLDKLKNIAGDIAHSHEFITDLLSAAETLADAAGPGV